MKILGIDPALARLGWGIIACQQSRVKYLASGTINTSSKDEIHKRLSFLTHSVTDIIDLYQPDLIAMEETFINLNPTTSLKLGYVRGAIMSVIGRYDIPFFEYKPNTIKKTITGVGHAEKEQMVHMIKIILSGCPPIRQFDEADALAVAYTGAVYGIKPAPGKVN